MKKPTREPLNVWKMTAGILAAGAVALTLLLLLTGCAMSFGKGDVRQSTVLLGRQAATAEESPEATRPPANTPSAKPR